MKLLWGKTLVLAAFLLSCSTDPGKPGHPNDSDQCVFVEDTTRVYNLSGNEYPISKNIIFARFDTSAIDTGEISLVLNNYGLQLNGKFFSLDQQWAATLCVIDSKHRSECYFTPYGKPAIENFGSDPLVEYSFGVFFDGAIRPSGNIDFEIQNGTLQDTLNRFLDTNGLRTLRSVALSDSSFLLTTLITPKAVMNVLDLNLGLESKTPPFVLAHYLELFTGGVQFLCN